MNISTLMDGLPLWQVFIFSMSSILLAILFGFFLGKRQHGSLPGDKKIDTGTAVPTTLGLLAFILALTVGGVSSSHKERKHLILDEANAISTLFLRADLLQELNRSEIQDILNEYLDLSIITSIQEGNSLQKVKQIIIRSEEIQSELWSKIISLPDKTLTSNIKIFILQSVNDLIDVRSQRVNVALHHRIPPIFWLALFALAFLSMVMAGYDAGVKGSHRSNVTLLSMALAFSVVILLITMLNRPLEMIANQSALINLQKQLQDR